MGGHVESNSQTQGLLDLGVTHIVSLLWPGEPYATDEPPHPLYSRVSYLFAPIPDDHLSKDATWFLKVVPFVLRAIAVPNTKVYGHCAAGRSRSGLLWYAVFRSLGMASAEAEAYIKARRPTADFWDEYRKSAESALKTMGYV